MNKFDQELATLQEICSKHNSLITSTNTTHYTNKRQAGIIIGGGLMALSYIRGLLSSSKSITSLQNDELASKEALCKNIYIVNTTVNNFQYQLERISNNERKYEETLQQIMQAVQTIGASNAHEIIFEKISQIQLQFTESAFLVLDQLNTLQNTIILGNKNLLHPAVISTHKMQEYLFNIHTPKSMMPPIEIQKFTPLK